MSIKAFLFKQLFLHFFAGGRTGKRWKVFEIVAVFLSLPLSDVKF